MKEENYEGNLICPMMIPKPIKCKVRYEIKSPIYLKKTTSIEKKLLNQSQLFVEKGIPVFSSQIKRELEEFNWNTNDELFDNQTNLSLSESNYQPITQNLRRSDPSHFIPPKRCENTIFLDPLFQTVDNQTCKIK